MTGFPTVPGLECRLDDETLQLAAQVVAAAAAAGLTLATAESLTGGLLGAAITSVPGASVIYRGGLITYATDLKHSLGGVDAEILAFDGAVSAPAVEALAAGAARVCGADVGLGLTGVAGPGEQEGHPAGTVFLGWYAGESGRQRLRLGGDRAEIRRTAVTSALRRVLDIMKVPPGIA
ncbi:CinA family protein [Ammonicoccus fulvus]|uniref:CinA family protein n=1 Tax=Ammonicoccus fulvus TaxID=3138240 RepID=A0ABZ3FT76_9ACTN